MSIISKNLSGFIFSGAALALASAAWKGNVRAIYGFTAAGNGYQVFKPANQFNSLTQLVPAVMYIVEAATTGFEVPGAVLAAGVPGANAPAATTALLGLDSFTHNFYSGYDNISLRVSSPDATYLLVFGSPGAYSYVLNLGDTISLSMPNLSAGQVVTTTAIAPSGARLVHTFSVGAALPGRCWLAWAVRIAYRRESWSRAYGCGAHFGARPLLRRV